MNHPEEQQSEARNRVLNAAYELFLQFGLTAVSMQQIAESAGISKATLYHHFRDKHHLYLATMRLALRMNEDALKRSLEGLSDLGEIVYELMAFIFGDERADLHRLASDFRQHVSEDTQEEFWKHFQMPWHLVQSAIANIDNVTDERAIFIARFIYGATSGLSHLYQFEEESHPITPAVLRELTDTILFGLTPDQPS